jgi:hypothetical protein
VSTLRWFYEAAIERILRKRLQERYDKGFLAGIDTAAETTALRHRQAPWRHQVAQAIREAREGYEEEIDARG